jgi:cell division protein FtsW
VGFAAAAFMPSRFWARMAWPMLACTVVLLALVLVPGIGVKHFGASRWLRIGSFNLQPSEIAKLALPIFLCAHASLHPARLQSFWGGLGPMLGAAGVVCGLVIVEPDIGTSAFLGLTAATVMVVAGARWRHLVPACGTAGVAAAGLAMLKMDHFRDRVLGWLEPESHPAGYQLTQSLIALGSGGWFGDGLGRGTQKLYFLPEVHSDFIFAVLGEELGFAGACAVLLLFGAFAVIGWRVAWRSQDRFAGLLAFTIIAVVSGVMPTKGIPLPFFSSGGSSLCVTMAAAGMLVRIANENRGATCESSSRAAAPAAISSPA